MTGVTLSVVLDGIIILLLAGTIFYAIRLSVHMKAFRNSRKDMEKLLADLSAHIIKADRAIEGLRQGARDAGRDLQTLISEARGLSSELQIMSESGNSLAGRLEKIADKTTRGKYKSIPDEEEETPRQRFRAPERPQPEKTQRTPLAGFAIRDREHEAGGSEMNEDGLMSGDFEEDDAAENFSSRAERELYEALRRKKTEAGGVS